MAEDKERERHWYVDNIIQVQEEAFIAVSNRGSDMTAQAIGRPSG
jgi:hypothetical protein